MAALIGILLFVSDDSQQGKADSRLSAGLQTAVSVYNDRTAVATGRARQLAASPDLATALTSNDPEVLSSFTRIAAAGTGVVRVELLDNANRVMSAAGSTGAVGFARVGLTEQARPVGVLRLSTT